MTGPDEGVVSPPGSNLMQGVVPTANDDAFPPGSNVWVKEGVTIMNGENGGAETCPGYTEDTLG